MSTHFDGIAIREAKTTDLSPRKVYAATSTKALLPVANRLHHIREKMADLDPSYTFTLTPLAYTLPLLHAARHLSTVLGIFLGRSSPSPSSSSSASEIIIEDAIPLIHHYTSLSPMTEVALEMAELYAEERGLSVVGVYLAPESATGLGRVGEKVLGAIREKFDGAFGMVVNQLFPLRHTTPR